MMPIKDLAQRLIDYLTRGMDESEKQEAMMYVSYITSDDYGLDSGDTYDLQEPPRVRGVDRELRKGLEHYTSMGYLNGQRED